MMISNRIITNDLTKGINMFKRKLKRRSNKKIFKRGNRVNKMNVVKAYRGGIRL